MVKTPVLIGSLIALLIVLYVFEHPSSPRYQLVASNLKDTAFIIDTSTGRTWQLVEDTSLVGNPRVWQNMDRVDDEAQFNAWVAQHEAKQK
jgi:hypothetical protein